MLIDLKRQGDPAELKAGFAATPEAIEESRQGPRARRLRFPERYVRWVGQLRDRGDLGDSLDQRRGCLRLGADPASTSEDVGDDGACRADGVRDRCTPRYPFRATARWMDRQVGIDGVVRSCSPCRPSSSGIYLIFIFAVWLNWFDGALERPAGPPQMTRSGIFEGLLPARRSRSP